MPAVLWLSHTRHASLSLFGAVAVSIGCFRTGGAAPFLIGQEIADPKKPGGNVDYWIR